MQGVQLFHLSAVNATCDLAHYNECADTLQHHGEDCSEAGGGAPEDVRRCLDFFFGGDNVTEYCCPCIVFYSQVKRHAKWSRSIVFFKKEMAHSSPRPFSEVRLAKPWARLHGRRARAGAAPFAAAVGCVHLYGRPVAQRRRRRQPGRHHDRRAGNGYLQLGRGEQHSRLVPRPCSVGRAVGLVVGDTAILLHRPSPFDVSIVMERGDGEGVSAK